MRAGAESRLTTEWSAPIQGSDVEHEPLLLTGSPDALLEAAEDVDADLVVVGARGRGGFAGLHLGSVAHHLAHHTRRPLTIVPESGARADITRIVVGVDGSEGSAAAVRWCADMAQAANAEVLAVYAYEPVAEWMLESDPRSWFQHAQRQISDEWVAPLRSVGASVRTKIIQDIHPVAALARAIEHENAGLAVVGTRGLNGFTGLRLGRVPLQLVRHTQIPVVLVPAPTLVPPGRP